MIETIYLEIIILIVLVWLFESKLVPQVIIMFLTFAMLINEVVTSTDLQSSIGTLIIFATVIIYSSLQIYSTNNLEA